MNSAKLLGVMISDNLTWDHHIDYLVKKCNKKMHILVFLRRVGAITKHKLQAYTYVGTAA